MGVELEWVMLSSVGHRKQKEIGLGKKKEERLRENYKEVRHCAVSYTHLTLPTKRIV